MVSEMNNNQLLSRIRCKIKNYIDKHQFDTARFWADKVCSLSRNSPVDCYLLAQCMIYKGEYDRALLLLKKYNLHEDFPACRYLVAKCYSMTDEFQMALQVLENFGAVTLSETQSEPKQGIEGIPDAKDIESSIYLLKGEIYEKQNNKELANSCYQAALSSDLFCYEAFYRLVQGHQLTIEEENEILNSLALDQCDTDQEKDLVQFVYEIKLNKYHELCEFEVPESVDNLHENLEVASALAERNYYNSNFQTCYKMSSAILSADPYHNECLPLYITVLTVLQKKNELFNLAHRLIQKQPESVVSWYAVGCYYLLIPKKQEQARRYLLKATQIDRLYGPAWLALGHSFGLDGEHDQAMAAYFTSSQVMPGCHLPLVYIGLEYTVTNNFRLAEKSFNMACSICPDDPQLLHEVGVAAYATTNYYTALKFFNLALSRVELLGELETAMEEWEPLFNNLGHLHRRLEEYDKALTYHKKALALAPQNADTYACIGFVLTLKKQFDEAISYLHKSLSLRRDDVFVETLLEHVIEESSECDIFHGDEPEVFNDTKKPPTIVLSRDVDENLDNVAIDESQTESIPIGDKSHTARNKMLAKKIGLIETPVTQSADMFVTPEDAQPPPMLQGGGKPPQRAGVSSRIKSAAVNFRSTLVADDIFEKSNNVDDTFDKSTSEEIKNEPGVVVIEDSDEMDIDDTL